MNRLFTLSISRLVQLVWIASLGVLPVFGQEPAERLVLTPRVSLVVQWIEVEHADLHRLVGIERLSLEGPELHAAVSQLIESNKASVIESIAGQSVSGERGLVASIEELIYPTEFDPPDINATGEGVTPTVPLAFETRNVGFTVEFESSVLPGDQFVDLEIMAEKVAHRGYRSWGQAESETRMPDFYTIQSVQKVRVRAGSHRLLATHRLPEPVNPDRKDPRVLVFVRAEVHGGLPAPKNGEKDLGFDLGTSEMAFVFEYFETDQRSLDELLFEDSLSTRGPELRAALVKDVAAGKASLVDTSFISGKTGEEALLRSVLEIIYPTEYDPPKISRNGARILPATAAAFKMRKTGRTIKLRPELIRENIFSLSTDPEIVTRIGTIEHGKEDGKSAMPHFHSQKVTAKAPFKAGQDSLLATFRPPNPVDPQRKDAIWVLFVRGELIPLDPE